MSARIRATKPVLTLTLDASSSNISTSAWTQVAAATAVTKAGSAIEIFNSTGSTLAFSYGGAGSEASNLYPYTILQGGTSMMLPMEIYNNKRISVKALDQASVAGLLVLNLFG